MMSVFFRIKIFRVLLFLREYFTKKTDVIQYCLFSFSQEMTLSKPKLYIYMSFYTHAHTHTRTHTHTHIYIDIYTLFVTTNQSAD